MLRGMSRTIGSITDEEKRRMFELMSLHYDNIRKGNFLHDLSTKDGVLLFVDRDGRIQGFSTWQVFPLRLHGTGLFVIFSGDTVIDRAYWGSPELFRQFVFLLLNLLKEGRRPLYWCLLSKGIRTYLMLPLFLKDFHPRPGVEFGLTEFSVAQAVCEAKYPGRFDPARGVVLAAEDSDRMKEEIDTMTGKRSRDECTRFFLEKNPGYRRGDELVCVGRIDMENFRGTVLRMGRGHGITHPRG